MDKPLFTEFDRVKIQEHQLIYPPDHQMGMVVPRGGSACSKCEYVRNRGRECAQKDYINWNGSTYLPAPDDEYCCDFYEPGKTFKRDLYKPGAGVRR